jgi:trigger factor
MAARRRRPGQGGDKQGPQGKADATPKPQRGRRARPAPPQKAQAKPPSKEDARAAAMRRQNPIADKLETAQAVKKLDTRGAVKVSVPDLSGIRVEVQAPKPPDDAWVDRRIEELARVYAPFVSREPGDPIAMGDEILVDAVGYVHGDLFSSQMDAWLRVEPNALLPGLFESLGGVANGTHTVVPLTLPRDYPDADLAGCQAAFAVDIKAANARAGDVDIPAMLKELGYGDDEESQRKGVYAEIEEALALDLVAEAREKVLDVLEQRAPGDIPADLIEQELQRIYRVEQGEHLAKAGVSIEDQNAVFKAYTEDPVRRQQARRRLWEGAFLDALAEHLNVDEDKGGLLKLMTKLASAAGLTAASVHTAVTSQGDQEDELVHNFRRSKAAEMLLEQVDVVFLPSGE